MEPASDDAIGCSDGSVGVGTVEVPGTGVAEGSVDRSDDEDADASPTGSSSTSTNCVHTPSVSHKE